MVLPNKCEAEREMEWRRRGDKSKQYRTGTQRAVIGG